MAWTRSQVISNIRTCPVPKLTDNPEEEHVAHSLRSHLRPQNTRPTKPPQRPRSQHNLPQPATQSRLQLHPRPRSTTPTHRPNPPYPPHPSPHLPFRRQTRTPPRKTHLQRSRPHNPSPQPSLRHPTLVPHQTEASEGNGNQSPRRMVRSCMCEYRQWREIICAGDYSPYSTT